jgi:hypothetical protein
MSKERKIKKKERKKQQVLTEHVGERQNFGTQTLHQIACHYVENLKANEIDGTRSSAHRTNEK